VGALQGSPGLFRDHPRGDLPIMTIQPQRFGRRECQFNAMASFRYWVRTSQTSPLCVWLLAVRKKYVSWSSLV
jgi:hypothetical protein